MAWWGEGRHWGVGGRKEGGRGRSTVLAEKAKHVMDLGVGRGGNGTAQQGESEKPGDSAVLRAPSLCLIPSRHPVVPGNRSFPQGSLPSSPL